MTDAIANVADRSPQTSLGTAVASIMVYVDFDPGSDDRIKIAADWAAKFGAVLIGVAGWLPGRQVPAAQWTGAMRGPAFFAYADNYLIDVKFGIIVDCRGFPSHSSQLRFGAAKTMIERTEECFDLKPDYLAADTAYGSAETLNWVVNEKNRAAHSGRRQVWARRWLVEPG